MAHRITTIIFDLYNTLIYNKSTNPYGRMFVELGTTSKEEMRICQVENFSSLSDLSQRLAPGKTIDTSVYEKELADDLGRAQVFHDVFPNLQRLKDHGYRLCLISNLATPYKRPFFDLGLDKYMDLVVFSCDAGAMKPEPEIYYNAISKLGISPREAVMTGDSVWCDYLGPKAVGMNAVHLDRDGKNLFHCRGECITTLDDLFWFV